MTRGEYDRIEAHMLARMDDSAHDRHHIYRVLYTALDIANHEDGADRDILMAACLLHDIGRRRQFENPALCHAAEGAAMALDFLTAEVGWPTDRARRVADCIATHRYRSDAPPQSLEAKILFDADKLDAAGTMGIARTLVYQGMISEPLYNVDHSGTVLDGTEQEPPSFLGEYHYKLAKVYGSFFTDRGNEIGEARRQSAAAFYAAMLAELKAIYSPGRALLEEALADE